MSAGDLEIVNHFLAALADAAETGNRESIFPFLATGVEWVTPQRTLRGLDEVRADLTWLRPPDNLQVQFERGETEELGEGRIALDVHETYRLRGSGDFAYARERRLELTIIDSAIARYEMRVVR
jgi:hypothetical protein